MKRLLLMMSVMSATVVGMEVPLLKSLCIEKVALISLSKEGVSVGEFMQNFKDHEDLEIKAIYDKWQCLRDDQRNAIIQFGSRVFKNHKNRINALAVIDTQKVVSGSNDATLRVWDVDKGVCLQKLKGHKDWVRAVAVISKQKVVSGGPDKTLRVWNIDKGVCLQVLEGHNCWVRAVAVINKQKVVSGSDDQTLRAWDIDSGECLKVLNGHNGSVNALGVINKQKVVSGSNDKTLRVWDIDNGECLQEFKGHEDWVSTVAVINKQKVVSGSNDKTLRVWDIDKGVCLQVLEGHNGSVNAVEAIDEQTIVSVSNDRRFRIWDLNMPSLTAKQMIVLCTIATKVVNNQPMQANDALELEKEVQELFSDEKADEKRYKDKMLDYLDKRIDPEYCIRNLYK